MAGGVLQSGGAGGELGGAGGASSASGAGSNGSIGLTANFASGGGGGGSGLTGGNGGTGGISTAYGGSPGAGGIGGANPGQAGGNGAQAGGDAGGGGGGGGAHGFVGGTLPTLNAVTGGNGGAGGIGSGRGYGGGGGAGAAGAVITGSGDLGELNFSVTGGNGGNGANSIGGTFRVGYGGGGGVGIYFTGPDASFTNNATITGGIGGSSRLSEAAGGVGIAGSNLSIVNSGSISGGTNSFGTHFDAIDFFSGNNSLTPGTGKITGNIAVSGNLTILGANANISNIVTNYSAGYGALIKNDAGVLKLSNQNAYSGGTTITVGTLELGQLTSAGTGAITFAAGAQKLQIDVTGMLGNTLTTVDTSDKIDFQALNFTGAFKTYDAATRTLSVTNGASMSSVRFDSGSTLTSNQLVLSADADGSAVITVRDALTAAPTGTPGGGPVTVFTGAQNVTMAKADTLVLAVDPGAFTGASEQNGNVVLAIAGKTATVTGAQLTSDGIPGVSLAGGDFLVGQGGFSITSTKANSILIGGTGGEINNVVDPGQTVGTHVIFGGVGYADPSDGADNITFGGKGAWGVYGNAGADGIVQGTSIFDSTSFVSVFGGKDGDSITLANTSNLNAHFAIYGGEKGAASAANGGIDSITVFNTGANASTIIFGGQGAADSTDGADTIIFNGGGSVAIFGNAGDDTLTLGATGGLDSTTNAVVHGGIGSDTTVVTFAAGTKATTQVYGDEGDDRITVSNAGGATVIYGETAAADSAGGNDSIAFSGQGQTTIYAAGGNDVVTLNGRGTATADSTSTTTVFGGNGSDSVNIVAHTDTIGAYTLTLGSGADSVAATYATNGTVFGQTITITDFVTGGGNDVLKLTTPGTQTQASAISGGFQVLQQALDAATANGAGTTTAAGSVGVVAFGGASYVVVNDGTLGFNASTDLTIKLTGVTDVVGVIGSISILH